MNRPVSGKIANRHRAQKDRKVLLEKTIERRLALTWWDWPEEIIRAQMPLLMSDNIEGFLQAYEGAPG